MCMQCVITLVGRYAVSKSKKKERKKKVRPLELLTLKMFRFNNNKKLEIDDCWSCARGWARTVIPADVLHMLFYFRCEAINMRILDIIMYVWTDSFIHSQQLQAAEAQNSNGVFLSLVAPIGSIVGGTGGGCHFAVTHFKIHICWQSYWLRWTLFFPIEKNHRHRHRQ